MGFFEGLWQEPCVIVIWWWENPGEMTVNLLFQSWQHRDAFIWSISQTCFCPHLGHQPAQHGRSQSIVIPDLARFRGGWGWPNWFWKQREASSSLHPLDETGVKDAGALREWNGKACRQVEACSALSSTVGRARDHHLSLTGPSVLAMAKVCRNHAAASAAKSLQSCPTLCDPTDGSPPGSSVPGILQARTLEWVAISFSNAWKWKVKVKLLSRVWLFATPWTAAYQAPPPMGFSRQESWSRVLLPSLVGTMSACQIIKAGWWLRQ